MSLTDVVGRATFSRVSQQRSTLDSPSRRLGEIARFFTRLGFTAFGGPAAHVAMMDQELVGRRGWLDRQHFLDLIAAINFIPGPNSTELAIALGRLRGGWRGLLIAGVCFILPAVLIILPIGWLYVNYHALGQMTGIMRGVGAGIVAIVIAAVIRLARSSITDRFTAAIALLSALMEIVNHSRHWALGDVSILAVAAIAGSIRHGGLLRRPGPTLGVMPLAAIGTAGVSLWGR